MTTPLKPRLRLQNKLLISVTALVVLLVSVVLYTLSVRLQDVTEQTLDNDLEKTRSVFDRLQAERGSSLLAKAALIADDSHLKASIDVPKPDMATTADACFKLNRNADGSLFQANGARASLFLVTDKHGQVLFDSFHIREADLAYQEGRESDPKKADNIPSVSAKDWPNVQQALQGQRVSGAFIYPSVDKNGKETKQILQTVTVPIRIGGDVLGTLILGSSLDDALAQQLKGMTDSEIAVLVGHKVYASTWPEEKRPVVESSLADKIDQAEQAMKTSTSSPSYQVSLADESYRVHFSPFKSTSDQIIGDYAILRSEDKALKFQHDLQKSIVVIGVLGVAFAFAMTVFIAQRITKPLNSLLLGVQEIGRGNLNVQVPVETRDELAVLAMSFNEMIQGLREKERVTNILGKYISPEVAKKVLGDTEGLGLKGERRECAIMFTDIRGFTSFSENMAPEKLVKDLNEYFTLMVDVVFKYEGTLDKFIGDAIMAVWGAPVPFEDKELRSVKAALDMQTVLGEYNKQRIDNKLPPLTMGIGLNTGIVVSGNLGSDKRTDYTVIGEEVNLASRLCSKAAPGQTLISEGMYRKLKGLVEVRALEPIMLKGFTDPVKVYEVTGLSKA